MFTKKRIIIATVILAAIIGAFFLFRGCGGLTKKEVVEPKKKAGEPEKEKKPAVVVVMEPASGSTVPELNTVKFQFSEPVKTDKVKIQILDPKGKKLEGTRSGFDQKLLIWVLTKRVIETGEYKILVESTEKEFSQVSFSLIVGTPEPPAVPGQISDEELIKSTDKAINAILGR